jgi:transcriptional regulator with XRE-family HTH domain
MQLIEGKIRQLIEYIALILQSRIDKGLSQEKFAREILKISRITLSRYENGAHNAYSA